METKQRDLVPLFTMHIQATTAISQSSVHNPY